VVTRTTLGPFLPKYVRAPPVHTVPTYMQTTPYGINIDRGMHSMYGIQVPEKTREDCSLGSQSRIVETRPSARRQDGKKTVSI